MRLWIFLVFGYEIYFVKPIYNYTCICVCRWYGRDYIDTQMGNFKYKKIPSIDNAEDFFILVNIYSPHN